MPSTDRTKTRRKQRANSPPRCSGFDRRIPDISSLSDGRHAEGAPPFTIDLVCNL